MTLVGFPPVCENKAVSAGKKFYFILSASFLISAHARADCAAKVANGLLTQNLSQIGDTVNQINGVYTQRGENDRTGARLDETVLNTSNVNTKTFGKLFSRQVDGQVYAQPLYVPNLQIPGKGKHNVIIAATMHNTVYAFDADDPKQIDPLWSINLGPSAPISSFANAATYNDVKKEIGILSTPAIDPVSKTIYTVTENLSGDPACAVVPAPDSCYSHVVHALDLTTGQEKMPPVTVKGDTFDSPFHLQRASLLLDNGLLHVAFAGRGDPGTWHGWVFSYAAKDLKLVSIYNATPGQWGGGVWQAGQGLTGDGQGHVFFSTGNGTGDPTKIPTDRNESVVKLDFTHVAECKTPKGCAQLADYFTPANAVEMNRNDADLASAGVVCIHELNRCIAGGKPGIIYTLDPNHLGHTSPDDAQAHPFMATTSTNDGQTHHIHGTPVVWKGPDNIYRMYVWGENDVMRAFKYVDGDWQKADTSNVQAPDHSMPGGILAISSHGSQTGSCVVWANLVEKGDANAGNVNGVLRAFDCLDLSKQLWSSEMNGKRDALGGFAKFVPPTIANGKVYMATFSNSIVVYGKL